MKVGADMSVPFTSSISVSFTCSSSTVLVGKEDEAGWDMFCVMLMGDEMCLAFFGSV